MEKTKIVFSIGVVLAVLAVLTAPAVADTYFYLVPQDSSCDGTGCTVGVTAYLHTDRSDIGSANAHLDFVPGIVNITDVGTPTDPVWHMWDWKHMGDYVFFGGSHFSGVGPGELEVGILTLECESPSGCPIEFTHHYPQLPDPTATATAFGENLDFYMVNGTFTCVGSEETFSKPLLAGWNLISLPLTATDMTVSNVIDTSLGGSYDELYKYNATTDSYAPMAPSDTMANGVGYFINMTAEDTWTYSGTAYTVLTCGHSDGLNMIGWLNCTKDISATGLDDTAKTYYVSRWDATTQEYETYNPVAPGDFNDFTQMVRGEGYFISMKTSGTLSENC